MDEAPCSLSFQEALTFLEMDEALPFLTREEAIAIVENGDPSQVWRPEEKSKMISEAGFWAAITFLQPQLRKDPQVRMVLLRALFRSDRNHEFFAGGDYLVKVLLEEMPDFSGALYRLRCVVCESMGEDGLSTNAAHRIMMRFFPDDDWFFQAVIRMAGGWGFGFEGPGHCYVGRDLTDSAIKLLEKLAVGRPEAMPLLVSIWRRWPSYCTPSLMGHHPEFRAEDYELGEDEALIKAGVVRATTNGEVAQVAAPKRMTPMTAGTDVSETTQREWQRVKSELEALPNSDNPHRLLDELAIFAGDHPEALSLVASYRERFPKEALQILAMRWPDDSRVVIWLIEALESPHLQHREVAARMLCRGFATHPPALAAVRARLSESDVFFGEYMAANLGQLEAMQEGLHVLAQMSEPGADEGLAKDGPLYLVRYFGPRKDLLPALVTILEQTSSLTLQLGICRVLQSFYPKSPCVGFNATFEGGRFYALEQLPVNAETIDDIVRLAHSDPSPRLRLKAMQTLQKQRLPDAIPMDALLPLVGDALPEAQSLLCKLRPQDEATARWLLDPKNGAGWSKRAHLTQLIAEAYAGTPTGQNDLFDRIAHPDDDEDLSAALSGLCSRFSDLGPKQESLLSLLMDSRLKRKAATDLLNAKLSTMSAQDQLSYLCDIADKQPHDSELAKIQAVGYQLGQLMFSPPFADDLSSGSDATARGVRTLIGIVRHDPRDTERFSACNALGFLLLDGKTRKHKGKAWYEAGMEVLRERWLGTPHPETASGGNVAVEE